MTTVFINGFGRIGRTMLRAWALGYQPDLDIVGINDIAAADLCAHLFTYDSVFGPFTGQVALQGGHLVVNGRMIPIHRQADISALDLSGVDIVAECTGKAGSRAAAEGGLRAGARRVLISGPSDAADATIVLGANDADLADQAIISNASCTTNALAPLVRVLDAAYGLRSGWMTTIHCYTGSQPTIDAPRDDFLRSRAAALSMVPTTTSAQALLGRVLPHLAGRIEAAAVRVPVASVSAIDLTAVVERTPDLPALLALLRAQTGVIGHSDLPLVSSDLRARPQSLIIATPELRVTSGGLLRVFGWYDNEWGFSCRMLDMAARMG
jgi:glyceraldehyde 3-phosphate dehydrogenase